MKKLLYLYLMLSAINIIGMENQGGKLLNSDENNIQNYGSNGIREFVYDISNVRPPETPSPQEIIWAKKIAFKIVINALKKHNSFDTEKIRALKKLNSTPQFQELIDKYIRILTNNFFTNANKYNRIYNQDNHKSKLREFWQERRKELFKEARLTYTGNKVTYLESNLEKLSLSQLNALKINALGATNINASCCCNRQTFKKTCIPLSLVFIADLIAFYLIVISRDIKLPEEEIENISSILIWTQVAIYPLFCILGLVCLWGDMEDVSDFDNLIDKINETMENFVDPNAVPDENEGPEISEII